MVELYVENITHIYPGNVVAVKDVTLRMPHGSSSGLLGPSGCGKTTLMKIIAGLLKPTEGKIFFDGEDITSLSPQERNIAMVFQFPVVYDMSVFDNLAFPLRNRKVPEKEVKRKVLEVAELLDLTSLFEINARKLDAGGKQRVALGRALIRSPNVFLLDEPLTNIDPESRLYLRAKIKEVSKSLGQTVIYVTHDQAEALTLTERIAVMKDGMIVQFDKPEILYERPMHTFVSYFIGNPGMNLLNCTLEDEYLDFGDFVYDISELEPTLEPHGNEFIMGIRPEWVQVNREKSEKWLPFKCSLSENLGNMQLLHLTLGKTEVKAKLTFSDISEGDVVWVNFPMDKVRIFKKTGERLI